LFERMTRAYGAYVRFDVRARKGSWEMVTSRRRMDAWAAAFVGVAIGAHC
jgi:hypothetical protein